MSGTYITLHFSAVVDDYDRLPAEIHDKCDRTGHTADEIIHARLWSVMAAAGQKVIDEHPDWFRAGTELM